MSQRHLLKIWTLLLLNIMLVNVFAKRVKNWFLHSHFHKAGRTIPQIVLRWFSSIPEAFMPLVDGGHTAWIHCFWTSNQFHRLFRWFPKLTQNLITVTAQLNVSRWRQHFLTRLVKTLATLDVKKQQSSNFTVMTSGRYVSIWSFRDVFTLSQTTLVKLILIANCREF